MWYKVAWAIYIVVLLCSCSDNEYIECHPINDYLTTKLDCCLEESVISIFTELEWMERHNINVRGRIRSLPPPPTFGIAIIGEGEIALMNEKGYDFDVGILDRKKYNEEPVKTQWSPECLNLHKKDCCVLRTSEPIFSKSGKYILIYAHTREYGWRFVYKFNKEEGEWIVVDERMIWIT